MSGLKKIYESRVVRPGEMVGKAVSGKMLDTLKASKSCWSRIISAEDIGI